MTATRATDTLRVLSTVLMPTMAAGVLERWTPASRCTTSPSHPRGDP